MTLTRMIPSLRLTLPDPLSLDRWPEATTTTVTDVVVAGISLVRLAEVYGTPCGFTGASVIPHTDGRPSPTSETSVRVVRITRVKTASARGLVVETDGELDEASVIISELRLIGRASTAHVCTVEVAAMGVAAMGVAAAGLPAAGVAERGHVDLPADLRVGDLLAVPCHPAPSTWSQRLSAQTSAGFRETENRETENRETGIRDAAAITALAPQPAWLSALE